MYRLPFPVAVAALVACVALVPSVPIAAYAAEQPVVITSHEGSFTSGGQVFDVFSFGKQGTGDVDTFPLAKAAGGFTYTHSAPSKAASRHGSDGETLNAGGVAAIEANATDGNGLTLSFDASGSSSASIAGGNPNGTTIYEADGLAEAKVHLVFTLNEPATFHWQASFESAGDAASTRFVGAGFVVPGTSGSRSSSGSLPPGSYDLKVGTSGSASLFQRDAASISNFGHTAVTLTITPASQPPACRSEVPVGHAVAEGCFKETAPGSGVFTTDQTAWVGGFEV